MREIRTYGSMRGLQRETAHGPARSSRVRRTVLDHSGVIPLRSTLLFSMFSVRLLAIEFFHPF